MKNNYFKLVDVSSNILDQWFKGCDVSADISILQAWVWLRDNFMEVCQLHLT